MYRYAVNSRPFAPKIWVFVAILHFSHGAWAHEGREADDMRSAIEKLNVEDSTLVIFGESQHRILENHQFATAWFKYLVETRGFRILTLESSWRIADVFHRFESGEDVFSTPDYTFAANAFDSIPLRELFVYAKEFNRIHPESRILITGLQPESPVSDTLDIEAAIPAAANVITTFREACGLATTLHNDWDFIALTAAMRREHGAWFIPGQLELETCQSALRKVRAAAESNATGPLPFRVAASLLGLETQLLITQRSLDEIQQHPDQASTAIKNLYERMDENRLALFNLQREQLFPKGRVLIWLHNVHAARNSASFETHGPGLSPVAGTIFFGALIKQAFGPSTKYVGSATFDQKFNYSGRKFIEPQLNKASGSRMSVLSTAEHRNLFTSYPIWLADGDGTYVSGFDGAEQFDQVVFFPALHKTTIPSAEMATNCQSIDSQESCENYSPNFLTKLYRHVVEVTELATKVGNSLDYKTYGNKPSPWYQDFFGILAVKSVDHEQLKQWFLPAEADLVAQTPFRLKLSFHDGYEVEFFTDSYLSVQYPDVPSKANLLVNSAHAEFSGATHEEYQHQMDSFLTLLRNKGLTESILVDNPYYDLELKANARLESGNFSVSISDDFAGTQQCSTSLCLWLLPDPVHGNLDAIDRLNTLMPNFDWISLEAFPAWTQPQIDAFLNLSEDDPMWKLARACLVDVISSTFGHYFPQSIGDQNPYFRLLERARALDKSVHAMDIDTKYQAFRYGDALVGSATRSLHWAMHIPRSGSGVVFGGSAHFDPRFTSNGTFQDFVSHLFPRASIFRLAAW